jgi:hypothetical protein
VTVTVACGRCDREVRADIPRECCNSVKDVLFAGIVVHEIDHHLHELEAA